jgi:homoserine dehydrogenase
MKQRRARSTSASAAWAPWARASGSTSAASGSDLEARLGARIVLKRAAVRDLRKARGVKVPASRLTTDALSVATDPDIDIVCELMGGTTSPAR